MSTTLSLPQLDQISIASPCPASWDDMTGDEVTRHCALCNQHVHNIAGMTREEAEALLASATEGRVCVRIFRRHDGTILTRDCPVGVSAARERIRRTLARIGAAFGVIVTSSVGAATSELHSDVRVRSLRPIAILSNWLFPAATPTPTPPPIMGKMCAPRGVTPPQLPLTQPGASS